MAESPPAVIMVFVWPCAGRDSGAPWTTAGILGNLSSAASPQPDHVTLNGFACSLVFDRRPFVLAAQLEPPAAADQRGGAAAPRSSEMAADSTPPLRRHHTRGGGWLRALNRLARLRPYMTFTRDGR